MSKVCEWVFPAQVSSYVKNRLGSTYTVGELAQAWDLLGLPSGRVPKLELTKVEGAEDVIVSLASTWPSCIEIKEDFESAVQAGKYWDCRVNDMPEEFMVKEMPAAGWCHLLLQQDGINLPTAPWPTVQQLLDCGVREEVLDATLVRQGPGQVHVGSAGSGDWDVHDCVGGKDLTASSAFDDLWDKPDFTVCKCRVHQAPRGTLEDKVVGCCRRQPGIHGVIQAAAEGKHVFCHAEPDVRKNDRALLELMVDEPKQRSYTLSEPIEAVRKYASSDVQPERVFGRGYCYLGPVYATARWRLARLFGPNPLASDVLQAWRWCLLKSFKEMRIVEVAANWYHVEAKPGASGTSSSAGVKLYAELEAIVAKHPKARVGVSCIGPCSTATPRGSETSATRTWMTRVEAFEKDVRDSGVNLNWGSLNQRDLEIAITPASGLDGVDKSKKRVMELAGNALVSLISVKFGFDKGMTSQQTHDFRVHMMSGSVMAAVFAATNVGKIPWTLYTGTSSTEARMLESMIGAVCVLTSYQNGADFATHLFSAELAEWWVTQG